ncbi:hypothetical protein GGF43_002647, partial [Coemansia sp. RSA 2618]
MDDDEQLNVEDFDFVRENAKSLSFLSSVNPESLTNIKKQLKEKKRVRTAKPKVAPPTELSETEDEDDDDSDVEMVAEESDSDMEILSESEEEEEEDGFVNSKERRALKRKAMFGGEMSYEQSARSFAKDEKKPKVTNKLPIKTADGRLALAEYSDEEEEEEDEEEEESDDEEALESGKVEESGSDDDDASESDDEEASAPDVESKEEETKDDKPDRANMSRKGYIVAQQNRLAKIADSIMQNPEGSLSSLKTLQAISEDADPRVKRLGLLTQLAVFSDILPGYRIRELTDKEKEMKVTKEVRQQRMFEERLVRGYSAYLKQLFTASKRAMKIFSNEKADIETGT